MPQSRLDKNCIKITKMGKTPINLRQSAKIPHKDLQTNLRFVDSHQLLKPFFLLYLFRSSNVRTRCWWPFENLVLFYIDRRVIYPFACYEQKRKHWYNEDAEMCAVMTADVKTNLIYTKKRTLRCFTLLPIQLPYDFEVPLLNPQFCKEILFVGYCRIFGSTLIVMLSTLHTKT